MAKRRPASQSDALNWTQTSAVSRSRSGWGIVSYSELTGRYRIKRFLGAGKQPYFALIIRPGPIDSEQISRHATLEEAKAACEEHLREQSGG
jgi:hypothetical protein